MELLIPTEKISLLLKISHTIPVAVVHPSSLENYCSPFVLVLTVLPAQTSTQHDGNGTGLLLGKTTGDFLEKRSEVKNVGISKATYNQSVFALLLPKQCTLSLMYSYLCVNLHLCVSSQTLLVVLVSPNPACLCATEDFHFQLALKHWNACSFFSKPLIPTMLRQS